MATSRPTAQDIRAAAEIHDEIAPEYKDAVVASFLERIDQHIAARVDEQISTRAGGKAERKRSQPVDPARRMVLRSVLAGSVLTGIPLSIFCLVLGHQLSSIDGGHGWAAVLIVLWIAIITGNIAWAGWYRRPPS
jgi:hypothetical protein